MNDFSLQSRRLRLIRIFVVVLISVAVIGLATSLYVESRHVDRLAEYMTQERGSWDVTGGKHPPWIEPMPDGRWLIKPGYASYYVLFVDLVTTCGPNRLVAVNHDGKPLEWQWDYRDVQTVATGHIRFFMAVPNGMLKGKPGILIPQFAEGCAPKVAIYARAVKTKQDWPFLLYNDYFTQVLGVWRPGNSNGYKVMAIKPNVIDMGK